MNTRRTTGPVLPVADQKGFDKRLEPGASLKSVAESGVLVESLIRSRNKWLYDTFPKYASKPGRGINVTRYYMGDPDHPPSFHDRGTCDVDMGPHTFSNTQFFEVYRQGQGPPPSSASSANVLPQPAAARNNFAVSPLINFDLARITDLSEVELPTGPHERREYLRRVHNAIAYDAKNAAAVQAVVAKQGKTVDDVLAMLQGMMDLPQMPFDLAICFEETPPDRCVIPHGPALFEELPNNDANLTLVLPFDQMIKAPQPIDPGDRPSPVKRRVVSLTIRNITPAIADTLKRWIGGEERMDAFRDEIDILKKRKPLRLYLGPQVKSGSELLAQLKAIAEYPMKTLKQAPKVQRPVRAKQMVQKPAAPTQSAPPVVSTNPLPTSSTHAYTDPSPDPSTSVTAPALTAPFSAPPSHPPLPFSTNPYPSISTSYTTYPTSASSYTPYSPYPTFPQPPPPPPPFFPLTTIDYSSTSTTTPYGSQLYASGGLVPTVSSSHYTYAHYLPAYAPYLSRPDPIPRVPAQAAPRYKPPVAIEMKCLSCGAKDVPLYYGGRFCRPCQDEGRDLDFEARTRYGAATGTRASPSPETATATRPSPYPATKAQSLAEAPRPRSRPRYSTQAVTAPKFSLNPATFQDADEQKS